jgi:hyperosmotically inducible periplasmic protein
MKFAIMLVIALASAPAFGQEKGSGWSTEGAKQGTKNAALTGKVKSALANDVGLKTLVINVDSEGSTVTLKGTVDNADTKSRAEQVAKKVEGVKSVKNELKVKGS